MKTEILEINAANPDRRLIERAGSVIRSGGLVAFPTETVYGVGANALDPAAVRRIFEAKGRPAENPVILHVESVEGAKRIVASWPEAAQRLAHRFWPGPLTLVLPKQESVPNEATAGGPTVAIRVPLNAIALELIRASACPIAAPSANRSSSLSPTRAEHVLRDLGGRIDLILDGGPTTVGIESTVLDLSSSRPRILRPGAICLDEIEELIGPVDLGPAGIIHGALPSPGMQARHYAPRTPVQLIEAGGLTRAVAEFSDESVGCLLLGPAIVGEMGTLLNVAVIVEMPESPTEYATRMYDRLHWLDEHDLDRIAIELPPDTPPWLAIRDRLHRAATKE